jgi:hypothetical protein
MPFGGPGPKGLYSTNRVGYVDSVLNANKGLDWVQRLHEKNAPTFQVPGEPDKSTHFMGDDGNGYVFPTVVRVNGKMTYLGDRAEDYAHETNTGIQFPKVQGTWFANNGYKIGTGVNNSINSSGIPYNNPKYKIPGKYGFGGEIVRPFVTETDPGTDQKSFFKEYLNSPNYKKRLSMQGYTNLGEVVKDRLANLNATSIKSTSATESKYTPGKGIYYSPTQSAEFGYPKESTLAHEFSHASGSLQPDHAKSSNLSLNQKELQEFQNRNKLNKVDPNSLPIRDYMNWTHNTMQQEPKADMDALRYRLKTDGLYDTGTQTFDKKILQKAKERYKDDNIVNRLFKNFSDDDLLYLMNNVASNKQQQQFKPFV